MDTNVIESDTLAERVRAAADSEAFNQDEVWEGVYLVSPSPNDEHQEIVANLVIIFGVSLSWTGLGHIRTNVNISDREKQWEHNFRCPDVVVYLKGTKARNLRTRWLGGPDFAVEVVSRNDRSRQKLDFYAKVGTRELLLVDRDPWRLELYRLIDGAIALVGKSTLDHPDVLVSEVVPLSFRLQAGEDRPRVAISHVDGVQSWSA